VYNLLGILKKQRNVKKKGGCNNEQRKGNSQKN